MAGIFAAVKEGVSKAAEKGKELKSNIENLDTSETKEFSELQKKLHKKQIQKQR